VIAAQSHRALRVLLLVFAILFAIGGLLLVCSPYIASLAPSWLHAPPSIVDLIALKFIGIMAVAMSYLSYVTSRDPVRYVAFIDALAFLLIAAAFLDLYASFVLHIPLFVGWFVILRSVIRIGLALALIALRPRQAN
jgi:hypothetical protein